MTIKAILRDGQIQPLEPLPPGWADGQELLVEQPDAEGSARQIEQWAKELEEGIARIPAEEHQRFLRAIDEVERSSKEAVRRQWGLM